MLGLMLYSAAEQRATPVAEAQVEALLVRNLLGLGVVGLIVLAAAWWVANKFVMQPVDALVRATERLRGGDLSARSGLPRSSSELSRLAEAFDEMANSLQTRSTQVREAEAKYRALVEQSLAGVYIIADDRFVYFNEAGAQIFGYSVDEIAGRLGPMDLVHPDDRSLVASDIRARIEGQTEFARHTFRGLRKDGGIVHCESFGRRVTYGGKPAIMGTLIDVTERRRAEEQALRQVQRLSALRTIDVAITASLDLRVTLSVLLDQVTMQLQVDAAAVLLLDPRTQAMSFAAGRGLRGDVIAGVRVKVGEGDAGRAALERRTVSVPELGAPGQETPRTKALRGEGFVAYFATPLVAKGQVKGVLEVFHRARIEPNQEWLGFLEALAGQAAIAVDNAWLFADLQRANVDLVLAYDSTLEGWSRALDLRDRETEGHTLRVMEKTLQLARAMGLSDDELVHVRRGALLHDIGKMAIPDSILLKPGPLSDDEWVIMRKHPVHAYELLSPIPYLRMALDIPYCHHEKWDGTGYPRGLKGEQIPKAARIFAVVDVWDALRSDRPYRRALTEGAVREHIASLSGTHFEAKVAELFLRMSPTPEEQSAMEGAHR